jgi:hypothetical protein
VKCAAWGDVPGITKCTFWLGIWGTYVQRTTELEKLETGIWCVLGAADRVLFPQLVKAGLVYGQRGISSGEGWVSWGYLDLNTRSAEIQTKLSTNHANNFLVSELSLQWNNAVVLVPILYLWTVIQMYGSGGGSVGIETGSVLDDRGVWFRVPVGSRIFLLHVVQTCSGVHPTSYSMDTRS